MKFITFLASSMLIVLISQHSTLALPVNENIIGGSCLKGFEMIDGHCMLIKNKIDDLNIEISTPSADNLVIVTKKPVIVLEATTPRPMGRCSEGFEHGKYGICQEIKMKDQVKVADVVPTGEPESHPVESEIRKGCPEGTEADQQGACIDKTPVKFAKIVFDPKLLLNDDGSCPEHYKMIQGQCLYIKPKQDLSADSDYSAVENSFSGASRTKHSNDQYGSESILSDNSCPEGTAYSDYGLCRRRPGVVVSDVPKSIIDCSSDSEFINGKCTPKKTEVENLMDLTTKIVMIKKPFVETAAISENQPITFTTTTDLADESPVKIDSLPTTMPF